MRVRGGPAASFDSRLADAVLEAERRPSRRELVAVLAPDELDPGQLGMGSAGLVGDSPEPVLVRGEHRDGDVDVGAAQGFLPMVGTTLTDVTQDLGPSRHALPKLGDEAVEGRLRHAERLQPLVGESDRQRRIARLAGLTGGGEDPVQPPDQLTAVPAIVDAEQQVDTHVRRGALEQRTGLDVVELEGHVVHVSDAPEVQVGPGSPRPGTGTCWWPGGWRSRRRHGSWGRDLR